MKFEDTINKVLQEYSASPAAPVAPPKPKVEPKPGEAEPKRKHPLKPRPGVKPRPQAVNEEEDEQVINTKLNKLSPDIQAFLNARSNK